jgi:hypothetical protein
MSYLDGIAPAPSQARKACGGDQLINVASEQLRTLLENR